MIRCNVCFMHMTTNHNILGTNVMHARMSLCIHMSMYQNILGINVMHERMHFVLYKHELKHSGHRLSRVQTCICVRRMRLHDVTCVFFTCPEISVYILGSQREGFPYICT